MFSQKLKIVRGIATTFTLMPKSKLMKLLSRGITDWRGIYSTENGAILNRNHQQDHNTLQSHATSEPKQGLKYSEISRKGQQKANKSNHTQSHHTYSQNTLASSPLFQSGWKSHSEWQSHSSQSEWHRYPMKWSIGIVALGVISKYQLIEETNQAKLNTNKESSLLVQPALHELIDRRQLQKSKVAKIWYYIKQIARLIQVILIFSPVILFYPLRHTSLKETWLNMFMWSVEQAGVVWIKMVQYMSHRRDMIGQQLAKKFSELREHAPTHSFDQTKQYIEEAYGGKKIEELFTKFDPEPIASGSISQVYMAEMEGKKVAVKVRHPGVEKHIVDDIDLLFNIAKCIAYFSPKLTLPVGEESLKKTLVDQIDLTIENRNLDTFNYMFKNSKQVFFPKTIKSAGTKESVLVETFIEGKPITYYESHPHPLNRIIARIGATCFFEMLLKNNFIHADCHGGNLIVEISKNTGTFFGECKDFFKEKLSQLEAWFVSQLITEDNIRRLYLEYKQDELNIQQTIRKCAQSVRVALIDVGMVITLNDKDQKSFRQFLQSAIQGQGDLCAQMIYNMSNYGGQKIVKGVFEKYMNQLTAIFSTINNKTVEQWEGLDLLKNMLNTCREHQMKLDGEFATLITNMLVLEAMAREVDPNIKLLRCAMPYLASEYSNISHNATLKVYEPFLE